MPRKRAKRASKWAFLIVWAILLAAGAFRLWQQSQSAHPARQGAGVVTHFVDGDTIDVSGYGRIRLIGIDTPERGRPGFVQATERTRALCDGQAVRVEVCPVRPTDRYGRTRALIYLPDGMMLNTRLLEEGWAVVYTLPPCHVDSAQWLPLERAARDAKRGLWDNADANGRP